MTKCSAPYMSRASPPSVWRRILRPESPAIGFDSKRHTLRFIFCRRQQGHPRYKKSNIRDQPLMFAVPLLARCVFLILYFRMYKLGNRLQPALTRGLNISIRGSEPTYHTNLYLIGQFKLKEQSSNLHAAHTNKSQTSRQFNQGREILISLKLP